MAKRTPKPALIDHHSGLAVLPTPRLNLHDLEATRREMAKVYKDMRWGRVATQDGARLVYVLGELRKMFEVCELDRRITQLEEELNEDPI